MIARIKLNLDCIIYSIISYLCTREHKHARLCVCVYSLSICGEHKRARVRACVHEYVHMCVISDRSTCDDDGDDDVDDEDDYSARARVPESQVDDIMLLFSAIKSFARTPLKHAWMDARSGVLYYMSACECGKCI